MTTEAKPIIEMVPREAAETLAVAYNALQQLLATDRTRRVSADWNGIAVWGRIVLTAQRETGISLMNPDHVNHFIEDAVAKRREIDDFIAEIDMTEAEGVY